MPKKLPIAGFVLSLLCFALPFVQVSCTGQKIATLNGFQLLTGTTVNATQGGPPARTQPAPAAVIAFILVIAAIVLGALGKRIAGIFSGICGLAGAASLMTLASSAQASAPPSAMGMLDISYQPGYYLAVGLMLCSGVVALVVHYWSGSLAVATSPSVIAVPAIAGVPPPPVIPPPMVASPPAAPPVMATADHFCSACGAAIPPGSHFCAACGHPVH